MYSGLAVAQTSWIVSTGPTESIRGYYELSAQEGILAGEAWGRVGRRRRSEKQRHFFGASEKCQRFANSL
jgi:predicted DNA-binding WGR domain protein